MALGPLRKLQQTAYVKSAIVGHFKAVRLCRFVAFLFTFALCIFAVGLAPLGFGGGVLFRVHGLALGSRLFETIVQHVKTMSIGWWGYFLALGKIGHYSEPMF